MLVKENMLTLLFFLLIWVVALYNREDVWLHELSLYICLPPNNDPSTGLHYLKDYESPNMLLKSRTRLTLYL